MASDVKISVAASNAACNAIVDLVDGGAGDGYLQIRTGSPPANTAAANTGTLLVQQNFSDPAFGNAGASVDRRADAAAVDQGTVLANGDAGHFRVFDSNNVCILQGTAGEAADSPDLTLDEKTMVTDGTCDITSFYVTVPEQ